MVGSAGAGQIRSHRLPRVRNLLDTGRSARPGAWPATDCLALRSGVRQSAGDRSENASQASDKLHVKRVLVGRSRCSNAYDPTALPFGFAIRG